MSVAMNGASTKVLINQFDGTNNGNGVILTTTEFASLMFQLKAIEHSFVVGERKAEFISVVEKVDKSTETDVVTQQSEKQVASRVGTKGELHERLKNAPKKREGLTETLQQQQLCYDNDGVCETYNRKQDLVRAAKRPVPFSQVADSKDEHCDIMKNAKKRRRFSKSNYDTITMAFAKALRAHIDGIVTSQCLGCMLNISYDRD